ncbi:MAG: hypothetical protein LBC86_06950, partial [Oscillospiraceae bacterium]|nr:hypothetical protein [Oscillospiraceae bacterium]
MEKLKKCPKTLVATLCVLAILLHATIAVAETDVKNDIPGTDFIEVNDDEISHATYSATPMATDVSDNLTINVVHLNGIPVLEIYNPTDRAISTKGMYLSNGNTPVDEDDYLFMWQMPAFIIRDGQSIFVRSTNDNVTQVLKRA